MKFDLPLHVTLPRKTKKDKRFTLNLNIYRNTFHMTLNEAKRLYKDAIQRQIPKDSSLTPPLSFSYVLYPQSKRMTDLGNVMSIVQKFTEDALVEAGLLEDDNYHIIPEINFCFGEIDKDNPRVELTIKEVQCTS